MGNAVWALDVVVGLAVPVALTAGARARLLRAGDLRRYWLGVALGLTWEVPLFVAGTGHLGPPAWVFLSPFPLPSVGLVAVHALWDGGLLLAGTWFVRLARPGPHFVRPRVGEAAVLVAWGQLQELVVEVVAIAGGAWTYRSTAWNPAIVAVGPGELTLVPQLVWLVAPLVYYWLVLRDAN